MIGHGKFWEPNFPPRSPNPKSGFLLKKSISFSALLFWICVLAGCRPEKPIEVSYHDKPEYMMLAGILINGNEAWTIKATGKREAVVAAEEEIHEFAKTFDFSVGPNEAEWDAPESWKDTGESSSIRKATYEINSDSETEKVTLFVSFFASGRGGDPQEFIAENVNRWRGQMGVAKVLHYTIRNDREIPLPSAELIVPFMTKIPVGSNVMYFQRIEGIKLPSGAPPFAGKMGGGMGMGSAHPSIPTTSGSEKKTADSETKSSASEKKSESSGQSNSPPKLPFKYDAPKDWKETSPGTVARLKFSYSDEDPDSVVSISFFPPINSVNWESTVAMWQGQLSTAKTSADELAKMTKSVPVDAIEVKQIELTGQEKKAGQSLVGAMISRPNGNWFVKLTGKTEAVKEQQSNFDSFIKSIKFDAEEEK